jgi:hypothetical protein
LKPIVNPTHTPVAKPTVTPLTLFPSRSPSMKPTSITDNHCMR